MKERFVVYFILSFSYFQEVEYVACDLMDTRIYVKHYDSLFLVFFLFYTYFSENPDIGSV